MFDKDSSKDEQEDIGASGSKSLGKQPITRVIHMITKVTEEWIQSKSKIKQYLRSIMIIGGSFKGTREDEN